MSILFVLALTACRSNGDPTDTSGLEETGLDTGPEDSDNDGFDADFDCDDSNAEINPGAIEICDAVDNNCDGFIDEELLVERFIDADGDGYGDSTLLDWACPEDTAFSDVDGDCDDAQELANPGLQEVCGDHVDNDCDGGSNDCAPSGALGIESAVYGLLGAQSEDLLGLDVYGSPDLNGDGLAEVLIGSLKGGQEVPESGAAHLISSQPSGQHEVSTVVDATVTSTVERDFLGYRVRGGVDLNGDAQRDWVATAPGDLNRGEGISAQDRGEVFIFSGDLSGTVDARESALLTLQGETPSMHFGVSVAMSDAGATQLAVGSRPDSPSEDLAAVYLFTSVLTPDLSSADADAVVVTDQAGEEIGNVVLLQDLDGDGVADLMLGGRGAPDEDFPDAHRGTVAWFTGPLSGTLQLADADGQLLGSSDDFLGQGFSVGDMNGDGYLDLAASVSNSTQPFSGAAVFLGPLDGDVDLAAASAFVGESETSNQVGSSLDMSQDMDGDGNSDLLLGAWAGPEGDNHGQAYLFLAPFSGDYSLQDARASWSPAEEESAFGFPVRFTPDATGDGTPDVLIGAAYTPDLAEYGGAAWLFAGSGL